MKGVLAPSIYPRPILKYENSIYARPICVFHWKTLNCRFGICASNKFLSHASPEINDGRDFISFPWSMSQVQMGLG
jgi:hypothetical protein